VPERRATFVILANSDGLSRWRSLGDDANVLAAPAAQLFLKWLQQVRAASTSAVERSWPEPLFGNSVNEPCWRGSVWL
jgi:hypothetical protein